MAMQTAAKKGKPVTVMFVFGLEKVLNYLLLLQRRSNKRNKILIRTKKYPHQPMSRDRRKGVSVSHDKRMCGVQQTRCKNAARNSKVWGKV